MEGRIFCEWRSRVRFPNSIIRLFDRPRRFTTWQEIINDRPPPDQHVSSSTKESGTRTNATNLSRENFLNFTIFNSSPVIIGINLIYDFSLFSFFNDLTFVKLTLIKMAKNRIKVGTRLFIHRCEQVCEGGVWLQRWHDLSNRDFINHHPQLRAREHSYSRPLNVGHSKEGEERGVSGRHYHGLHR